LIEPVLPAIGAQPAKDRRRADTAGLDREHDAQHVGKMGFNQVPVDIFAEEIVDVLVTVLTARAAEIEFLPVADARHELDPKQISQSEDRLRLPLGIGVENVRLDVAFVLEQPVKDIDGLSDAARDEVAEERYVGVGYMVVADAAVADVVFGDEVLLVEIPARPIGRGVFS
jgi:hypothetical protein